jgi:hypothetical protein
MTTHAPSPVTVRQPVPPDEAFWIRYSPHHEFPLSAVTSFVLHALVVALLLLVALKLIIVDKPPPPPVIIGAVWMGGNRTPDISGGSGNDRGLPAEAGDMHPDAARPDRDPVRRPDLKVRQGPVFDLRDPSAPRPLPSSGAIDTLGDKAKQKLSGLDDRASGRPSSGNPDRGPGNGPGPGGTILTQRDKRLLRWTLHFNISNTPDYLAQMVGLGGVLAIPVERKSDDEYVYRIVRDPHRRPVQLVKDNVTRTDRIRWKDGNRESVDAMMALLGLNIRPDHFAAYMPPELEAILFELEKAHAQGHTENEIDKTEFRIRHEGGRYFPVFDSITFKDGKKADGGK